MVEFLQEQGTLFVVGFSFFCFVCFWSLNRLQRAIPSPVNKAILRWVRLFLVSLFIGLFIKLTILPHIPMWRLYIIGLLGCGLIETTYFWLYILAWDKSELPLFPTVRSVEKVDWPANKRFFLIKDWVRQNSYNEIGSFSYYYQNEVLQTSVIFESPDKLVRMQVLIVTDASGVILDQVAFISETEDGDRIITDNVFMPYGGVYPENWKVSRFPYVRKIESLAKTHSNKLSKLNTACVQLLEDPLDWTENSQKYLEETNVEYGFLNAQSDRGQYGKMTGEGRYRIWKELLKLNYFCRS